MARFTTTVSVEGLAVDKAFGYLSDFSSAQDWDPGVASAKRLDSGTIKVGSTFEVVASFMGREVPLTYEVIDLRQDELLVLRAENGSVVSLDELSFVQTVSGCAVTYDAELTGKGGFCVMNPVLPLIFKRIGRAAEEGLSEHLHNLVSADPHTEV